MVPTGRGWTRMSTRCSTPSSWPPATTRSQDCQSSKVNVRTGMEAWRGRQMHSHSYRVPEPFCGEVVVVVGCGDSGRDIAMEIRGVAKEVYMVAGSMEAVTPGLSKVLAKHSANLHLRLEVERLCEDGRVAFKDGGGSSSSIAADTVIYCTGYNYSFPFLDTGGAVAVDDNRVGPLFEHVFPPSLAPSLSFVGLLRKVFAPRSFEAQARWVAQYVDDFGEKYCDFPRQERWQYELLRSTVHDMMDKFETFRDDYQDSNSIGKAVQEWHLSCLHSSSMAGSEVSGAGAKREPVAMHKRKKM
uniref:Flavin-containing monooxygenase n=1 Tax=Aegilops tauschii subsp. strangulata TaxID=200361 RepID=A0A453DP61_AEGTS